MSISTKYLKLIAVLLILQLPETNSLDPVWLQSNLDLDPVKNIC